MCTLSCASECVGYFVTGISVLWDIRLYGGYLVMWDILLWGYSVMDIFNSMDILFGDIVFRNIPHPIS